MMMAKPLYYISAYIITCLPIVVGYNVAKHMLCYDILQATITATMRYKQLQITNTTTWGSSQTWVPQTNGFPIEHKQ